LILECFRIMLPDSEYVSFCNACLCMYWIVSVINSNRSLWCWRGEPLSWQQRPRSYPRDRALQWNGLSPGRSPADESLLKKLLTILWMIDNILWWIKTSTPVGNSNNLLRST
jgi:hypothetical protein